jgi:class 3 adenylate cyclase
VKPTAPRGVSNGLSLEDPCKPGISGGSEYKQVTVLFADVVDSMDIASAVGAERLLAVWLNETSAASARKSIAGGGTSVR